MSRIASYYLSGQLEIFLFELNKIMPLIEENNEEILKEEELLWEILVAATRACGELRVKYNDYEYDSIKNKIYRKIEIVKKLEKGTLY